MQIDSDQINCYLTVARLKSFTKAADVMYMTQSAVSRKVATLEKELNVTLIQRGKRELTLTEAGKEFEKFFQDYLSGLNGLQRKHVNIATGRISFGIFHGCNIMDEMGEFIADFQRKNPAVEFYGNAGDSTTLIEGLRTRQFDFVIGLKEPLAEIENIEVRDICQVHRTVVFSKKNKLANKEKITLEDFAEQIYYAFTDEKTTIERSTNRKIFDKYGIKPKTKILSNMESVIMALNRGIGYVLLDERQRIMANTEFRYLKLPETQMLSIAYRRNINKKSTQYKFMELLIKEFEKMDNNKVCE